MICALIYVYIFIANIDFYNINVIINNILLHIYSIAEYNEEIVFVDPRHCDTDPVFDYILYNIVAQ